MSEACGMASGTAQRATQHMSYLSLGEPLPKAISVHAHQRLTFKQVEKCGTRQLRAGKHADIRT